MPKILLIDSHQPTQKALKALFENEEVHFAPDASSALHKATEERPDAVILELSLGGHSGMEFLYEFCSYMDWAAVPVIVYTRMQLTDEVLRSRTWETLAVSSYLYKPATSLSTLKQIVEKVVASP